MTVVVGQTELPLERVRRGKVRDVYAVDADRLLLVASDRVSAFDVVLLLGAPSLLVWSVIGATSGIRHEEREATLSPRDRLIARAKSLELDTSYVPPPGDPLDHHTSGFAKIVCSAVFITGLDPGFAAENVGYFTSPYAERAKVGSTTVYSRRRKDAAFRLAWSEAVAQAYARLEVETLERALAGKARTIVAKDGSEERVIEYDERTALALLRLHRDNAREPERREVAESAISIDEANEVRDRLLAKIKRVRVRLLGQAAGETDGWDAVGKDGTLALTGPASASDAE